MKKIILYALVVIVISTALAYNFTHNTTSKKLIESLEEKNIQTFTLNDTTELGVLQAQIVGDTSLLPVLLIHGSPGEWSDWSNIITDSVLCSKYYFIAVNRPGYGATTIMATDDLQIQANCAWLPLIKLKENKKVIVVGHSYGGAVVAKLLVHKSTKIRKAVLVAPAVAPNYQEAKWYNKLAKRKVFNWFIGAKFKSSNIEMLGLSDELKANESQLADVNVPIDFIHGEKDMLVPYKTVAYWNSIYNGEVNFILKKKMNHFVPWSDPKLIIESIKSTRYQD